LSKQSGESGWDCRDREKSQTGVKQGHGPGFWRFSPDADTGKVGATHCTGDEAIQMFREEWGNNFVELGVGRKISISK